MRTNSLLPKGRFWNFKNNSDGTAELRIYGDILSEKSEYTKDLGVNLIDFCDELDKLGDVHSITVRINSGGGDVFTAQSIGARLKEHKAKVTAKIDGLCASAATIIACHCDEVIAAKGSTYMIHPVRSYAWGYYSSAEFSKEAETLDIISESVLALYVSKTGKSYEDIKELVEAETWYTAQKAKEAGFVDEVSEEETSIENWQGKVFVNGINTGFSLEEMPDFIKETIVDSDREHKKEMNEEIKTVDDLVNAYPDLVGQIIENSVKDERERIKEIEDMTIAGCEALAQDAKFDKAMSADDFAKVVIKGAKAQGARYVQNLKDDAGKSGVANVNNDAPDGYVSDEDSFINDIYKVNGKERKVK